MNDFEKYLQRKGLSKATIKHYNTEALNFIAWCDIQNVEVEATTSTEITGYLQHLQNKGYQNKTRNTHLGIIKHYFDYQLQHQKRNNNPAEHIKIRGTKHRTLYPIFTPQELQSLYAQYPLLEDTDERNNRNWFRATQLGKQRNKLMISLMINQALATDEVNRLKLTDVKLKEGKLFIEGTRKSNERELELKSHQIMELMEYQLTTRKELLQQKNIETDLYFIAIPPNAKQNNEDIIKSSNLQISTSINVWKRLSQELRAYNKKFINFQQVRASVITHWLKQYNLRQVQYMAGHRYISSTESYLINNVEELQNDIENFHPIG